MPTKNAGTRYSPVRTSHDFGSNRHTTITATSAASARSTWGTAILRSRRMKSTRSISGQPSFAL
jgi:hypothetical protein